MKALNQHIDERFAIYHGDSCELLPQIPENSVDYIIYSPPFSSLYTYSASERDLGNCKDDAAFFAHYRFITKELYRILKPGRLLSFHCMLLPTSKSRDGVIGVRDFRGDLIRIHEADGFIHHSEVVIWKDPVTAMQRTKALGLLYKQLRKDSCMSRQGIPDYLITMRKAGVNQVPVTKTHESFPVDRWQEYASPVWNDIESDDLDFGEAAREKAIGWYFCKANPIWMDIDPSNTLQRESARESQDERHVCPLQLQVIHRAVELWTNPNDVVLSPFAGIGSEGYESIKMGRKFIGVELKKSYYEQARLNLISAQNSKDEELLFK